MRRTLALLALLACNAPAWAQRFDVSPSCEVESDWDFHLRERSLILLRDGETPSRLVMRQGRLFVDDAWVELGAEDRRRLAEYEREARAAVPLVRDIAAGASDIALGVLSELSIGFGADPAKARADAEASRARIEKRLHATLRPDRFAPGELGEALGLALRETLPSVVGDVARVTAMAVLSGDAGRLQRLDRLDAEIEALVRPRAEALERDSQALCARMHRLDALDQALDYRAPGGRPLDLLRVRDAEASATP